jgi:hypothetical protein
VQGMNPLPVYDDDGYRLLKPTLVYWTIIKVRGMNPLPFACKVNTLPFEECKHKNKFFLINLISDE